MQSIKEVARDVRPHVIQCKALAPYTGCHYEQNYWLLKDRKVYPLYVSGPLFSSPGFMFGLSGLLAYCFRVEPFMDVVTKFSKNYSDWSVDLPEDIFFEYTALNRVTVLLRAHEVVDLPTWDCCRCEEECTGLAKFLGYSGNSCMGLILTDPCCAACFSNTRWCARCNKYVRAVSHEPFLTHESSVSCSEIFHPERGPHELLLITDEAEKLGCTGFELPIAEDLIADLAGKSVE